MKLVLSLRQCIVEENGKEQGEGGERVEKLI